MRTTFFFIACTLFLGLAQCTGKKPGPTTPDAGPAPEGKLVWSHKMDETITATPTVANEQLYVASWSGQIKALHLQTGKAIWSQKTKPSGMISQSVVVWDNVLYASSKNHFVYAWDASTGKEKWRFKTRFDNYAMPSIDAQGPETTVYVTSNDRFLYALRAQDGTQKWSYKAASGIRGRASIHSKFVFVGDLQGILHAVRKDGTPAWTYQVTGHQLESLKERISPQKLKEISQGWILGAPAFSQNDVFFAVSHNLIGSVSALNIQTGKLIWKQLLHEQVEVTPLYHEDTLYVSSNDHHLYALNSKDGSTKWKFKTQNTVRSTPVIVQNKVYFTSSDGHLYVLDKDSGLLLWQFKAPDSVYSSPAVYKGIVYFGCTDESIYAVKGPSASQ